MAVTAATLSALLPHLLNYRDRFSAFDEPISGMLIYNARDMNLNESLSSHESSIQTWLDTAKRQVAAVQKLQKAAQEGNLRY
jgi:hypothetical protein